VSLPEFSERIIEESRSRNVSVLLFTPELLSLWNENVWLASKEKFVKDFAKTWAKVMRLDRFDLN
jgi:catalase (peroxidase I)